MDHFCCEIMNAQNLRPLTSLLKLYISACVYVYIFLGRSNVLFEGEKQITKKSL